MTLFSRCSFMALHTRALHKAVMTSNEVREECLECHMTSNDVREEYYIIVMMGRCVNKPVQTEPGGCYENTFISKFAQLC